MPLKQDICEPRFEEGQRVRVTPFCSSEYRGMEGEIVEYQWNQFDLCFYYEVYFKFPQTEFMSNIRFDSFPEIDLEKV